jgi:hypothetical protein
MVEKSEWKNKREEGKDREKIQHPAIITAMTAAGRGI